MSTTVTLTADRSAWVHQDGRRNNTAATFTVTCQPGAYEDKNVSRVFIGFAQNAAYLRKTIVSAYFEAYMRLTNAGNYGWSLTGYPLTGAFDEATVAFDAPTTATGQYCFDESNKISVSSAFAWVQSTCDPKFVSNVCLYGLRLGVHGGPVNYSSAISLILYSSHGANAPRMVVTFSDQDNQVLLSNISPAAGAKLNRLSENIFQANFRISGVSITPLTVTSGVLRWRKKGDTAVHEIQPTRLSNVLQSVSFTVPANTFPAGEVEYEIVLTDSFSRANSTGWIAVKFEDTVSRARAVSPVGALVDGDAPVEFVWEHINESGSAQTKAELQYGPPSGTWQALVTVSGPDTRTTIPAGKFSSGNWYWRVRTYNLDGVAGSWSDAALFMAVSHPTQPVIVVTGLGPRPSIRWQTSEQEAYQLQLEGVTDLTVYGPEKTWRCPAYLADGSYTVRVRSQNQYGLWSPWGEAVLAVSNRPGPAVTLRVAAGHEAALTWDASGYDFYLVYRDGIPIARTAQKTYTDRWSAGDVTYQVRGCYNANDNYGLSNAVQVQVLPETVMIADVETGQWLRLGLSDVQHRTVKAGAGREVSSLRLAGRRYPAAELSEFYTKTLSADCAFTDRQDCARLEALMGRVVCLKDKAGDMAVGPLDALEKTVGVFYTAYSFSVAQCDYQEEIDIDTGDRL